MERTTNRGVVLAKAVLKEYGKPATFERRDQETGELIEVIPARILSNGDNIAQELYAVDIFGNTISIRRWDKLIEEPAELGDLD